MFERLIEAGFDIAIRNHAGAILSVDFPDIAAELENALLEVKIKTGFNESLEHHSLNFLTTLSNEAFGRKRPSRPGKRRHRT